MAPEPGSADQGQQPSRGGQHVAIVTGLSGAGKTAASKLFEDLGYTVVDNVPSELLADLAELVANDPERYRRVALVLDVRSGDAPSPWAPPRARRSTGVASSPRCSSFEASDQALVRRFSETRHRHPLETDHRGLANAIDRERRMLEEVRGMAQVIIDTSDLSQRQLRERITGALDAAHAPDQVDLQVISFGFKHGVPLEADLVFDVRFMENPFYQPELRSLNGRDAPVREFVLRQPVTERFLAFLHDFYAFAVPAYQTEGKSRVTTAIGCTGGVHRSVAIAEALAEDLRAQALGPVRVWHRELERT
ncbi:MAG: RNase adapter RapZ [Chloroflexota bacterium]